MKPFKNIPNIGFEASNSVRSVDTAIVQYKTSGTIALTLFAVMQLIAGGELIRKFPMLIKEVGALEIIAVLSKLFNAALAPRAVSESETILIDVLRGDVEAMVKLLEIRMKHCEEQRDNSEPSFNADTYIGQKMLLLELKGWLSAEILSFDLNATPFNDKDASLQLQESALEQAL